MTLNNDIAAAAVNKPVAGRKDDAGKVRMDLLPGEALFARASVYTYGAEKYSARNWEKGIKYGRVFAALMRHLWAWWQGHGLTNHSFLFGNTDHETGMSHLWHAGVCLDFLITYEMRNMTVYDDRPTPQPLATATPQDIPKQGPGYDNIFISR